MTNSIPGGVLLLIVGVILIVAGVGTALGGYNQTQAADEWASQTHYCGSGTLQEVECPENPYEGGGQKVAFGVLLAMVGGVAARYGSQ